MGILKILKEILKENFIPSSIFNEINEENLRIQKMKLGMTEYKNWLKQKKAYLEAIIIEREEKGLIIPYEWTEKIDLLEREIKEAEKI